jgi:hypothetical protein
MVVVTLLAGLVMAAPAIPLSVAADKPGFLG